MKNRVVETDDNVVALGIIYKGTRLLCHIDKVDLPKAALIRGTWHINRNTSGHIDHNTLNNVGNNLGEVSKGQNAQNVSITLNSTAECRNITIIVTCIWSGSYNL